MTTDPSEESVTDKNRYTRLYYIRVSLNMKVALFVSSSVDTEEVKARTTNGIRHGNIAEDVCVYQFMGL